jgi:hypothetical protein
MVMDKKEYIIAVLKKLEPYWSIISGVIAMVELWDCSDQDIDAIIMMIESHTKEIKDQTLINKLLKIKAILIEIRNQEETVKILEAKELEQLLLQIQNL